MRAATAALAALLNRVSVLYGGGWLMYERPPLPGDAVALLRVLKEGFDARKKRYEYKAMLRPSLNQNLGAVANREQGTEKSDDLLSLSRESEAWGG
jgi:hypothetical protein